MKVEAEYERTRMTKEVIGDDVCLTSGVEHTCPQCISDIFSDRHSIGVI